MKVGELAKKTGLSVRALHHYDELGLLLPSGKTDAGHRIYLEPELKRLQQIQSLKALGFSLEKIKELLDDQKLSLTSTINMHLEHLQKEILERQKLVNELQGMAQKLSSIGMDPSITELLELIEATTMFEKYYSPEQLVELQKRADSLGADGLQKAQDDWGQLIAEVKVEMQKGTDPRSERAKQLASRWQDLIQQFTGGDPAIADSLKKMYAEQGKAKASRGMIDDAVSSYIQKATD